VSIIPAAKPSIQALFGAGQEEGSIPTSEIEKARLNEGIEILALLQEAGLIPSKSEGRRLIQQGGISLAESRIDDVNLLVKKEDFTDGKLMIKKGKKVYHLIKLV